MASDDKEPPDLKAANDDGPINDESVGILFCLARKICGRLGSIMEITDHLLGDLILCQDDQERIHIEPTTQDRCRKLFDLLSKRGRKGYLSFKRALYKTGYHHISDEFMALEKEAANKVTSHLTRDLRYHYQTTSGKGLELSHIKTTMIEKEYQESKQDLLKRLDDKHWNDYIVSAFPQISSHLEHQRRSYYPLELRNETSVDEPIDETRQQIRDSIEPDTCKKWTTGQVEDWLEDLGRDHIVIEKFKMENIDGCALLELKEDDLKDIGLRMGDRKVIWKELQALKTKAEEANKSSINTDNKADIAKRKSAKQNTCEEQHGASSHVTPEQTPRQFKRKATKYTKYYRLQTDIATSFQNPIRLFHEANMEDRTAEQDMLHVFVTLVAACLNDRCDGIFHLGIANEHSSQYKRGQVLGTYLAKDKDEYQSIFRKAVKESFFEEHVDLVLSCVSHVHFIEVIDSSVEERRKYVLEIDIEASYSLCGQEAFFLRRQATPQSKSRHHETLLYRMNSNSNPEIVKAENISEFMKLKDKFARRRLELEEERDKRTREPWQDLRLKFLNLFANGEAILQGDMYPILVVNKPSTELDRDMYSQCFTFVSGIEWKAIFDFDAEATLCKLTQDDLAMKIDMCSAFDENSMNTATTNDAVMQLHEDIRSSMQPHWVFSNGHKQSNHTTFNCLEWKRQYKKAFKEAIRFFVNEIPRGRAMVVFALLSDDTDVILEAAEEMISAFPDQWMVVCDQENVGRPWMEELHRRKTIESLDERIVLGMPWNHLQGIVSELKGYVRTGECYIVTSSGSRHLLENKTKQDLSDLEILSMCECEAVDILHDQEKLAKFKQQIEGKFYKGSEAEWWNFFFESHHVCKREIHDQLCTNIRTAMDAKAWDCRVGKVLLYHQPGAGGTTTAKQMLWAFRKSYRCAVIRSISDNTAQQVIDFFTVAEEASATPRPVLLLLDNPDEEKASLLLAEMESKTKHIIRDNVTENTVVCVFLILWRRINKPKSTDPSRVLLTHELSPKELNWFKEKSKQLDSSFQKDGLYNPRLLISFNVMKENFDERRLKKMVKDTLGHLRDAKEKKLLRYVSLVNTYDIQNRSLPTASFDMLMVKLPFVPGPRYGKNAIAFRWETRLSPEVRLLINETSRPAMGYIHAMKVAHPFLSRLILNELSSTNTEKELLSEIVLEFLDCKNIFGSSCNAKESLLRIVLDIMKKRNRSIAGIAETTFAPLIQKIVDSESHAKASLVLQKGWGLSKDPFVAQQLARLFIITKDWERAEFYAKHATELRPDNTFLWDTYGRIYQNQLSECHLKLQDQSKATEVVELLRILELAASGIYYFRKSQKAITTDVTTNSAGYEGELRIVNLLLNCVAFAEPFYQNLHGFQKFLMNAEFVPQSLKHLSDVNGTNYMDMLKNLHVGTRDVLTHVDDEMIQTREENIDDTKYPMQRRLNRAIDKLKGELEYFFGESSDNIPSDLTEQQSCEFRRRRIFTLVGTSIKGIFEQKRGKDGTQIIESVLKYARENVASHHVNADDIQTLISANFSLLRDERFSPCESYPEMAKLSKRLYEMRSTRTLVYLEPYLFYVMFHWPRKSITITLIKKELEKAIIMWHDAYLQKYPRRQEHWQRIGKKDTTRFFFANGSGMRSICSHEQLVRNLPISRGDEFWKNPMTRRKLQRFEGTLVNDGTYVSVDLKYPKYKEQINIPTSFPIRERTLWYKRVSVVIGFSWYGPKAYDVTVDDLTQEEMTTSCRQVERGNINLGQTPAEMYRRLDEIQQQLDIIKALKELQNTGGRLYPDQVIQLRKEDELEEEMRQIMKG